MTIGELIDAIRRVEEAERELQNAEQAEGYGGSEHTRKWKRDAVEEARRVLNKIREEVLK